MNEIAWKAEWRIRAQGLSHPICRLSQRAVFSLINQVLTWKIFFQSCGQHVLEVYLYCCQCGTKVDTTIPSVRLLLSVENVTEKEAIEAYFYSGFSYKVILLFLDKYHDMPMSMSALKRRLWEYNLKRNKVNINSPAVERLILDEMDGLGGICGYRGVWHMLRI